MQQCWLPAKGSLIIFSFRNKVSEALGGYAKHFASENFCGREADILFLQRLGLCGYR